MANKIKRSPLKDKPLRNPGESVGNQLLDHLFNEILTYWLIAVICVAATVLEWIRFYFNTPPSPWTITFFSSVVIGYCVFRIYKGFNRAKSLRLGRDGEKAVGQFLEKLREQGAKIFHDIPGNNFNLDHVVISSSGIYVIETKTYSKPNKGEAKILFDGESINFMGRKSNKELIQVKAAANWLKELIEESTGHKLNVKPVIVFPGWFVETTGEFKSSDIWVLNPKSLPTYITNAKAQLSNEFVKMASFHLSRYVRTFEEKI